MTPSPGDSRARWQLKLPVWIPGVAWVGSQPHFLSPRHVGWGGSGAIGAAGLAPLPAVWYLIWKETMHVHVCALLCMRKVWQICTSVLKREEFWCWWAATISNHVHSLLAMRERVLLVKVAAAFAKPCSGKETCTSEVFNFLLLLLAGADSAFGFYSVSACSRGIVLIICM